MFISGQDRKSQLQRWMRPEEYLALQWKDADLERGLVTVRRALIRRRKGGGWYFEEPRTAPSRRQVPLPAAVTRALAEHRRRQAEAEPAIGAEPGSSNGQCKTQLR